MSKLYSGINRLFSGNPTYIGHFITITKVCKTLNYSLSL
jgi:hypothetical protein